METLIQAYQEIKNPTNLLPHIEDFEKWLDLAEDKESLEATLLAFQEEELYEQCIIIKNRIENYEQRV